MSDWSLCLRRHIAENECKLKLKELDIIRREKVELQWVNITDNRKQRINIQIMMDKLEVRLIELELEDLRMELEKENTKTH